MSLGATSQANAEISAGLARARNQDGIATSQARIASYANDAAADPTNAGALDAAIGVARDEAQNIAWLQAGAPAGSDIAEQYVRTAQAPIYGHVIGAALAQDPSGATAQQIYNQRKDQISGEERVPIQNKITEAQQSYQAKQRGAIGSAFNDNLAALESTGQPAVPLTPDAIMAAYGPDQGARIVQQLDEATATYHAAKQTALTSPDQDAATLASFTPHGAGFADQQHAQGVIQKVISQKWSAIARDPAGYVAANAPGMQDLLDAAGRDPTQLPAYAAAQDAAYDKLGIPAFNRPLLPQAAAQNLVSTILAAPPETRAQNFTDMINSYGDLKGRVLGDMVANKLPPQYEILAALPNSADRTLMAAAIGNTKQIRDGLPTGAADEIDKALGSDPNLADLARSLSYAPGGATKAGDITEALKPLAYSLVQQGLDPQSAAARAAAAITTSKYDMWEQSGGNVARVPKGMSVPVETAADDLLSSLTAEHLATPANPSGVNLTPSQLQTIALKSAQRGYWVTNEGDNGLVRLGDNAIPVMLANGKRLELPFSAVHALAGPASAPSPAPSTAPSIGGVTVPYTPPAPVAP